MSSPGETNRPGRIGPYEVEAELGRGGMGVVYAALDPRLERRVAIKVLSAELSRDREWNAQFTREARLLASLNHPNIATIYSLEDEDGLNYVTMELISGSSLEAMLRAGSLVLPEALSIGRQIARALEAAHGAGVIHRDLKPLNVMITSESHAKVLDFGLATRTSDRGPASGSPNPRPAGESTAPSEDDLSGAADDSISMANNPALTRLATSRTGADDATAYLVAAANGAADPGERIVANSGSGPHRASSTTGAGTPGYMSPEQIRGEILDARTDIWSFGCVLYECLSGKRAFVGATTLERVRSTFQAALDLGSLPPRTPESVRELIRSCLQRDRDARLGSIAEARRLIEIALRQRSWEAAVPEPGGGAGQARRRSDVPHSLPSEVTPLIGRAREVARVRELIEEGRLVTLAGIGGGGKTRLAIRTGEESLGKFADGVWMVELAPVAAGADVMRAAARTLGVPDSAGDSLTDGIAAHLAERSLLLILDNCEHVVEAAAELARVLLAAAPRLKILTTSREVLGLPGEAVFQVPPLQVASGRAYTFEDLAATEAIQLFAQRAAQVRSGFQVRPSNIEEIAEICSRLEGIPLAIELAAARTNALSLGEIARRLDDRFRLLRGTSRSALPQHQTLEALIEWSHSHLTQNEQRLYRRLSLFRGGWTLEAAESVCADTELAEWEILDLLTRLIDKSLVVFTGSGAAEAEEPAETPPPPEPRYRMLETVREFAQARWKESTDVESVTGRFQSYFTALVTKAGPLLMGPSQPEWLGRIDADLDNLRAAIGRALEAGDPAPALQITGQMLRYWLIRGQWREGRAALERAIGLPGADAAEIPLGIALNGLGSCCYQLNDLDASARHYQRAVDTFLSTPEPKRASAPLLNLGNVYRLRGDLDRAVASYTESLRYFDESDQWMTAAVQGNLGSIALTREDYDEARTRYERALAILRTLGDRVHIAIFVMNLALVTFRQGRLPEARALFEECTAEFEKLGDRNIGASAQVNYGITLQMMGAEAEAVAAYAKGLRLARETGSMESVAASLEGLSGIARNRNDLRRSTLLASAAESIRTEFNVPRHPPDQRQWESEHRKYALEMGEKVYAELWAEGRALPRDAAVTLGLEMAEESAGT